MTGTIRRVCALAIVVALAAVAAGCASDDDASPRADDPPTTSTPAADTFCAAWQNGLTEDEFGSEETQAEILRLAPPELADEAARLAPDRNANVSEVNRAVTKLADWVALNCGTGTKRRVAPPAGASLPGLTLCSAGAFPVPGGAERTTIFASIYGEAARADPYDGPMLGVFSTPSGRGGFAGDGEATSVTVRGREGVAAPITVFQQVIRPELGTVVTWTEDGQDVALYGRLWPKARTAELVALADELQLDDGRFTLPDDALPAGYEPVQSGPIEAASVVTTGLTDDYNAQYRTQDGGMITLSGAETNAEDYDAGRFLELPIDHERIGAHDALVGSVWSKDDGPWVVRWRDPDGFTVHITALAGDRDDVLALARASRELDRDEWEKVVDSAKDCPLPTP